MKPSIDAHSICYSLFLHLLPGILTGLVYYLLAPMVQKMGYPSVLALSWAGILVLIPYVTIFMFRQRRRQEQKGWRGLIPYLEPMGFRYYILWILVIIVASGVAFKALEFTVAPIKELFQWMPDAWVLHLGLDGSYGRSELIITYAFFLVLVVIVLPVLEEIYFRGYLLPRMPRRLGGWTVPLHSFLFALYHTWTPWLVVTRTAGVLPLATLVRRKRNIMIGILAHCLINSIDLIVAVIFIAQG